MQGRIFSEVIFAAVLVITLWFLTWASDFTLGGFAEAGRWSTSADYEEDLDESFSYRYYHLRFEERLPKKAKYSLSFFLYHKNYDSLDSLDNTSRTLNFLLSCDPKGSRSKTLGLDLKIGYRGKRYQQAKALDYDKLSVMPTAVLYLHDNLKINFSLGMENFNYPASKDKNELKFLGRIGCERFFEKKHLTLGLSYKIEDLNKSRPASKKLKQDVTAGADFKPKGVLLSELVLKASFGQRDIKDEKDQDQDYDYRYRHFLVKSGHKLDEKLDADFGFEYFKKTYISAHLGYYLYLIAGGWNYRIVDDQKHKLSLEVSLKHRSVNYLQVSRSDYRKETLTTKANFQTKKNWKVSAGGEENLYICKTSDKDKKRTYFVLSLEKSFLSGSLLLQTDFKMRFTDYRQRDDQELKAARLGIEHRF